MQNINRLLMKAKEMHGGKARYGMAFTKHDESGKWIVESVSLWDGKPFSAMYDDKIKCEGNYEKEYESLEECNTALEKIFLTNGIPEKDIVIFNEDRLED